MGNRRPGSWHGSCGCRNGGYGGIGSAAAGQRAHGKDKHQCENADFFHMKPPEISDFKASISKALVFKQGTFVETV